MTRGTIIAAVMAVSGCGILGPEEFWCSMEHHFTVTDSMWALPDTVEWNLEPDSVTTVWSVDGECPDGP